MKKAFYLSLFLTWMLLPVSAQRTVEDFNFGWKFHLGQADPQNLDTSGWRTIDVPHDFQIEQPWVAPSADEKANKSDGASNFKSRLSARAFKEMGEGWYVKTFTPAADLKNKRVIIDFEGIMYIGDVYLNGEHIGGTDYGYVGFEIDLTKKLKYGQENTIAVKASTGNPTDSRWYTGGGLFRDVHLITTHPQMYFARHPLFVTTKDNREVNVQIEVANYTRNNEVNLQLDILDAEGKVVYTKRQAVPFNRRSRTNELKWETIKIDNAHLWDVESPYLYTACATLFDSNNEKIIDKTSTRFGVRTFEIGPDFGLKLNGKKVLLKGIANHHSLGALGAAAYPRAIEKRLKLLKDFGFNHIRSSHNPYSESFLQLCDSLGFIVVDELYDKWLQQYTGGRTPWMQQWPYQLPEWIKRDRNYACIAMWSLGNELQTYANLPFNDWGVTPYRMLKEVLLRYDNTRKVTVAMHPRGRNHQTDSLPCDLAMITDIQAYNYRYMYFPGDRQKFPWMTFYQSEANLSMMGPNFFAMDLEKVIGLAYWGMIDYLGESMGWPRKGWTDGVFDISLQPKPMAYLLRSMFKPEEPVCHIGIIDSKADVTEWNGIIFSNDGMSDHWNRRAGQKLSLKVFTNADKVELMVNGKKVAEQNNTTDPKSRNQLRFNNIEYQPGYIEAIAYKNGKRVTSHRIETTGKTKKLLLTADAQTWHADGQDLQHVRITAVDSKGRRVPSEQGKLTFEVEGDARIVAVDNGNNLSDELHVTNKRSLYNGSALVILRAGKTAGKVTLKVTDEKGKTTQLKLATN
jgi:beta-galactosidase